MGNKRYTGEGLHTAHGAARYSTRMRSIIHSLLLVYNGTCCSMHGVMNSAEGFAL